MNTLVATFFFFLVTRVTNVMDGGLSHARARARAREGRPSDARTGDMVTGDVSAGDEPCLRHLGVGCRGGDRVGDLP